MDLAEIGEFGAIHLFQQLLAASSSTTALQPEIGIGDDAAVWRPAPGHAAIETTDLLIEEVHFSLRWCTWYDVGWKSMAVNVSDVAAMGAQPRAAFVSAGLSPRMTHDQTLELFRGLADCAAAYGIAILGGDTVASPQAAVVNVALYGESLDPSGDVLRRDRAKPGDAIAVSGPLGASAAYLVRQTETPSVTRASALRQTDSPPALPHPQPQRNAAANQAITPNLSEAHADLAPHPGMAEDATASLSNAHAGEAPNASAAEDAAASLGDAHTGGAPHASAAKDATASLGDAHTGGAPHASLAEDAALILRAAHLHPEPRVALGQELLRAGVRCGMDVSDGLLADLGKLCAASKVGAQLSAEDIPIAPAARQLLPDMALELALTGGEDYELLVCGPEDVLERLGLTVVGKIVQGQSVRVLDAAGVELSYASRGYDAFKKQS
jgi:thiamin-phosphate kinase